MRLAATKISADGTMRRRYVGVDIGGTNIKVLLVDDQGEFCGAKKSASAGPPVWSEPLGDDHDPRRMAQRIKRLAEAAMADAAMTWADVVGVGVCTPGLMDTRAGIIRSAANLKGWQNLPICDIFAEELGMERRRVALEHDVNAALLAEAWVGAAKGQENAVLMTLGTGIGAALLCDGRLLRGSRGQAGEIGHAILVPDGRSFGTAGVLGIFEAYGSASAVKGRYADGDGRADGPPKESDAATNPECAAIFKAAKQGEEYAMSVVDETARYLALGCINACRFVDPDVILFGGGMAAAGDFLLDKIRAQFAAYHWNIEPIRVGINCAALGQDAGVMGGARAAMLATADLPSRTNAPDTGSS